MEPCITLGMASVFIDSSPRCLAISMEGPVVPREIIEVIRKEYPKIKTNMILWDFSRADINSVSVDDFRTIAQVVKECLPATHRGRTVYVGEESALYNLMCVYTAIAVMTGVPAEYSVFHTRKEAEEWLAESSSPATDL